MKAQSAVESAIMISFMFIIFTSFLLIVSDRYVDVQEQKDRELIRDVGAVLLNEIDLALLAENGYSRRFYLPKDLRDKGYSISLFTAGYMGTNFSEVSIKYVNRSKFFEHVLTMPKNINGTLVKGENNVSKHEGMIWLNEEYFKTLPPEGPPSGSPPDPPSGCNCGPWVPDVCGGGSCYADQMGKTRDCNPDGCTVEYWCFDDIGCEVCIDSDGGIDYYLGGNATNSTHDSDDYCTDDVLMEFYCNATAVMNETYNCPTGCSDGACLPIACTDTDYGRDYYLNGTATNDSISQTDECTYCTGLAPAPVICFSLREYYCEGAEIKEEVFNCPNLCEEGACLPMACTDTDYGKDYSLNGTVMTVSDSEADYCTGNVLTEFYCEGDLIQSEDYTCANGCSDDACSTGPFCFNNMDCANNRFCEFDGCLIETGQCIDIPGECFSGSDPVCGCNARTYENDCYRKLANVSKRYDDVCDGNCSDSDGGSDYYVRGITYFNFTDFPFPYYDGDYCTYTDGALVESYCVDDGIESETYICQDPYVCVDGACIDCSQHFIRLEKVTKNDEGYLSVTYSHVDVLNILVGLTIIVTTTPPSSSVRMCPVSGTACSAIPGQEVCTANTTCDYPSPQPNTEYEVKVTDRACSGVYDTEIICWADSDCSADQFCDFDECLTDRGICANVPEMCFGEYDPVCGCNGVTYGNDCFRQEARVSKLHDGEC